MTKDKINELIRSMTLEEKASLCSGEDFWYTKSIERLGIPALMVSDGPHGLRKQEEGGDHLGLNGSIQAVCFPAGCATAASFDRKIVKLLGETIGNECQAEHVATILGPAMNIKRSPLCGRNFEYYSEDPYLTGELASAYVEGVQSKNIGTSPKHFAVNNQEYHRLTSSSDLDERTLREIYLPAFEKVVKQAKPWTIMNSYNRINGEYTGEDTRLLSEILRKEWGFDGYVMTDWGATNDRVKGLKAGCNLEMPGCAGNRDGLIVEAVLNGTLEESVLDKSLAEYLEIVFRYAENIDPDAVFDRKADHEIAGKLAEECIVLLKNRNAVLPLQNTQKVALIGHYAKEPRYQGGGSSHINAAAVTGALEAMKKRMPVTFAEGFSDQTSAVDDKLVAEAVELAKNADVAVIFAGLPDSFESEGYDRKHMQMPENQNALIEAIAEVQENTIVVLHNGSPVEMPWVDKIAGLLETYLGGENIGEAVAKILLGETNPSGRLPETFPMQLEDTPCYLSYGGMHDHSAYDEGVYVGYRYYCSKKMPVLFPFGYGLSYTTFFYSNLKVDKPSLTDQETMTVSVDVMNTGTCVGKEVVQLYVAPKKGKILRPVKELKGFEKIELKPGEKKTVSFTLDCRAFAYWDERLSDWNTESGEYELQIGRSAKSVAAQIAVTLTCTRNIPPVFTPNSTLGQIMENPIAAAVWGQMMPSDEADQPSSGETVNDEMLAATMESMPIRQLISFVPGLKEDAVSQMVAALNAAVNG